MLEPRLGAGAIDALRANLAALGGAVPNQVAARATSKASTVSQTKAMQTAAELITAIRGSVKSHKAADDEQDQKRATAPLATKARNAASKSVEDAVMRISAAGALQFAHEASKRARFEQLLTTTSAKKAPKPVAPLR